METLKSREIRLVSRPTGMPSVANFAVEETTLPPPKEREVGDYIRVNRGA